MSDLNLSGTEVPAEGGGQGFNFEQGYNQLRPEYTRTTQELSEVQQRLSEYEAFVQAISDPETQAEALASLGFEMETGVKPDEEFADPLEREVHELRGVVESLRRNDELGAAAREEQELLNMRDNYIGQTLDYIESVTKVKFDQHDEEILGNLAIAMADEEGVPDVQSAYNALYGEQGLLERKRTQWIDSKTGAYTAPMGTSIPADKRPATRAERVDFVDRRLQALDQMQQ